VGDDFCSAHPNGVVHRRILMKAAELLLPAFFRLLSIMYGTIRVRGIVSRHFYRSLAKVLMVHLRHSNDFRVL
jgi:hypothetical protein